MHCIKEGADDYLIKDRLARLGPAVLHALEEKRLRDEKRFAEAALRQSEQRYRSLVEYSPDAILVVAKDDRISYVNDAFAKLVGTSDRTTLLGRKYLEFVSLEYRAEVSRRTRGMLEQGLPTPLVEQQFIRLDGSLVDVEVAGIPCVYDGQPAVQRIVRDITDRRRAQEEARERMAQLTHVSRLTTMGELVSELAHEINQPLYAISNFAEASLNRFRATKSIGRKSFLGSKRSPRRPTARGNSSPRRAICSQVAAAGRCRQRQYDHSRRARAFAIRPAARPGHAQARIHRAAAIGPR